jgi:hypothetical protein
LFINYHCNSTTIEFLKLFAGHKVESKPQTIPDHEMTEESSSPSKEGEEKVDKVTNCL